METNVVQLAVHEKLWVWSEAHRKEVIWGSLIIVVVGVGIGFVIWQRNETETRANEALSAIVSSGTPGNEQVASAESLLKVAGEYKKTAAGARALLLAAGDLYVRKQFAESRSTFDRFLREYRDSPLADQALLGVAACLDAQGKIPEAITAYKDIVQHYSAQNVSPQAKLALATLYERQGNWAPAKDLYLDLTRGSYGAFTSEAGVHLEALFSKHPELIPQRSASTNFSAIAAPSR
ncbi:MAG TPA: tetratricopeptide repeat protein [Verrucomicrobiae bacterium]|nr:tetratricopeptide repeat protein [Verrucomicrobiae bacterium]